MTKNGVDGIYTADPRKNPKAKKIDRITHLKALNMRLAVMDTTALSLCLDNKLPIIVFDLEAKNGMKKVVLGESIGTLVTSEI
jgi:uridylate kinase